MSKAAQNKFATAVAKLGDQLHAAAEVVKVAAGKAGEIRKVAINLVIDTGRQADLDVAEIRDAIAEKFEAAVAAGDLEGSSVRSYMGGVRFALERRVPWSASLHSAEVQVQALLDAGKSVPKSLQAKAAEMEAKALAKREAKSGKAYVASLETVVKALAKALADARTLGKGELAADILDVIHSVNPEFTEPKAE